MLRSHPSSLAKSRPRATTTGSGAPSACVLVTGFEPFGGASTNSSWQVAQALDNNRIEGHQVIAAQLPTAFDSAPELLGDLLQQHRPALVVCLGQADSRSCVSLERVAINIIDARIADNQGEQPIDKPVVSGGPPAYFTSLPIKAMLADLRAAGIAAEVSQTAGTFVCNQVFYTLMHALERRRLLQGIRGGFIHLPRVALQGDDTPSMPLAVMQQAIHVAIGRALATRTDLRLGAGANH